MRFLCALTRTLSGKLNTVSIGKYITKVVKLLFLTYGCQSFVYVRPLWLITPPDPIGPHRTTPHSTFYFLPQTPGQSLILSLTYTLQTRLIISVPMSIQLWRICSKAYLLLVSKVCADCAELRYSEQLWTETTSIDYRVKCRQSALSRLNRVQLTLPSTQPHCWAVYMERVLARMSSYVLAVPSA